MLRSESDNTQLKTHTSRLYAHVTLKEKLNTNEKTTIANFRSEIHSGCYSASEFTGAKGAPFRPDWDMQDSGIFSTRMGSDRWRRCKSSHLSSVINAWTEMEWANNGNTGWARTVCSATGELTALLCICFVPVAVC